MGVPSFAEVKSLYINVIWNRAPTHPPPHRANTDSLFSKLWLYIDSLKENFLSLPGFEFFLWWICFSYKSWKKCWGKKKRRLEPLPFPLQKKVSGSAPRISCQKTRIESRKTIRPDGNTFWKDRIVKNKVSGTVDWWIDRSMDGWMNG